MDRQVRKAEGRSRYELVEDGAVIGIADYRERDDVVELPHTVIDANRRGEGLGAVLVKAVLEDLRPTGRKVLPTCWYVRQFIDSNPEYGDLVLPDSAD